MDKVVVALFLLTLCSCLMAEESTNEAESVVLLFESNSIDDEYVRSDREHYIVRNWQLHLDKLLLFIGGNTAHQETIQEFMIMRRQSD